MKTINHRRNWWGGTLAIGVMYGVFTVLAVSVQAADKPMQVTVGESVILKAEKVAKLAIADPAVADVIPLSDREISIIGKGPGVTTLTIVHEDGPTELYRLEVMPGAGVKSMHEVIGSPNITVREIGNSVVLEGKVRDERDMERAVKIATAYKGNVVNLLEVSDPRQVRIHMRLAEIRTDATKQLGIQYLNANGQVQYAMGFGTIEQSPFSQILGHGFFDPNATTPGTITAGSAPAAVQATLSLLAQRNQARILAEPTLVTLSGKEASFLSGGEVPIVQQLAQTFTVEFKEFGVRMKVKPFVDSDNRINTHILAEVSSVAPTITISGVPSFLTRRAETDVQVKDGQTIVISGLLNDQHDRDAIRKVPWLGDIPVLGVLFRSKDYQASLSELVVFVTPEVVKDIDGDTANAVHTPELKDWNGHQADEQLKSRQDEPYPKWQKPLDVDEFKPVVRPPEHKSVKPVEPVTNAVPAADASTTAAGAPSSNVEPARPATK